MGEGWLIFSLVGFACLGWSYMNDIKESKGRKSRKIYPLANEDTKSFKDLHGYSWARDRIAKGDENWVKFTIHKPRAAVHH